MRIAQITLATADPAGQARFWGEQLGLRVQQADGSLEVALQRSTIRLEPADEGVDARYHFAINVPPGSIEDAAGWLGGRQELLEFAGDAEEEDGTTIVHGSRYRLSETPAAIERPAPTLGRDNEHVLRELLGYDDSRIASLDKAGALT